MSRLPRRPGPRLNWQLIVPVVASVLLALGAGLLACCAVALADGGDGALAFGVTAAVVLPLGALGLATARRFRSMPLLTRDGFFAVTAAWSSAAIVGAVPFLLEGTFDSPVLALFESMSGFTTTGASVLREIEQEPDAILLWRSISQWLGGIGIVVLVVAIAPATGLASQRVFYAETTGVTADRLTPRIADTAKILVWIYLALTALAITVYWFAGMTPWDAVNHSFTSVSTGGFSTRTESIGAFDSVAVELAAIFFMVAAGVNFAFYWRVVRGRGVWPQAAEVRVYLLVLAVSVAVVTASLAISEDLRNVWESLRAAAFSATTTLTGTGYTTADFAAFNDFARWHLLVLMFVGGCAGSTTGGMKVIRVMLLAKTAGQEVQRQLRPRAVQVLRTRGRTFSEDIRRGVLGFFYIYIAVVLVGTFAMTASGLDLVTAFSSVVSTLNIVGPGLGEVGPTESFANVSDGGLAVLTLLMLIGRLEVFTVLVLLTPIFWRPRAA